MTSKRKFLALVLTFSAVLLSVNPSEAAVKKEAVSSKIRIGFFANVTHSPALVAQELNLFSKYFMKDKNLSIFRDIWDSRKQLQQQFTTYKSLTDHILIVLSSDPLTILLESGLY